MLSISPKIRRKLALKHDVSEGDIREAFGNMHGGLLIDSRADHATDPETQWFVAPTDRGRKLKVVFIYINRQYVIKTAYPANQDEINIYNSIYAE